MVLTIGPYQFVLFELRRVNGPVRRSAPPQVVEARVDRVRSLIRARMGPFWGC